MAKTRKKEEPKRPEVPRDTVLRMLREKSSMKQDVHQRTLQVFEELKRILHEMSNDLDSTIQKEDQRITVQYRDKGEMACEAKVAGDVIIFHMHTNVFKLDQGHTLWKTSYLTDDELRGYFGVINVYNFLSDSFKYNRERDIGYLVARIFLNKDGHFFVQGKRQLGFLYSDLAENVLTTERLTQVIWSIIMYVLDFDLLTPPYDQVNQVSVSEMNELSSNVQISTGKRLGFRFQADMDDVS
jgi:hypothetical protein